LARKIEQNLSKEEILSLYVNKIFLGKNAYGIAAAAKFTTTKALMSSALLKWQ
jgi:penicillin-binding protein 1A